MTTQIAGSRPRARDDRSHCKDSTAWSRKQAPQWGGKLPPVPGGATQPRVLPAGSVAVAVNQLLHEAENEPRSRRQLRFLAKGVVEQTRGCGMPTASRSPVQLTPLPRSSSVIAPTIDTRVAQVIATLPIPKKREISSAPDPPVATKSESAPPVRKCSNQVKPETETGWQGTTRARYRRLVGDVARRALFGMLSNAIRGVVRYRSAACIQRLARRFLASRVRRRRRMSAVVVQCWWRCVLAKHRRRDLQFEKMKEKETRRREVERVRQAERDQKAADFERRRAARSIQLAIRAHCTRRHEIRRHEIRRQISFELKHEIERRRIERERQHAKHVNRAARVLVRAFRRRKLEYAGLERNDDSKVSDVARFSGDSPCDLAGPSDNVISAHELLRTPHLEETCVTVNTSICSLDMPFRVPISEQTVNQTEIELPTVIELKSLPEFGFDAEILPQPRAIATLFRSDVNPPAECADNKPSEDLVDALPVIESCKQPLVPTQAPSDRHSNAPSAANSSEFQASCVPLRQVVSDRAEVNSLRDSARSTIATFLLPWFAHQRSRRTAAAARIQLSVRGFLAREHLRRLRMEEILRLREELQRDWHESMTMYAMPATAPDAKDAVASMDDDSDDDGETWDNSEDVLALDCAFLPNWNGRLPPGVELRSGGGAGGGGGRQGLMTLWRWDWAAERWDSALPKPSSLDPSHV